MTSLQDQGLLHGNRDSFGIDHVAIFYFHDLTLVFELHDSYPQHLTMYCLFMGACSDNNGSVTLLELGFSFPDLILLLLSSLSSRSSLDLHCGSFRFFLFLLLVERKVVVSSQGSLLFIIVRMADEIGYYEGFILRKYIQTQRLNYIRHPSNSAFCTQRCSQIF